MLLDLSSQSPSWSWTALKDFRAGDGFCEYPLGRKTTIFERSADPGELLFLALLHSLVEGVATVGIAIMCIFILPDTPQRARLLTPQEKDRLIYRLQMDRGQKDNTDEISAFKGFKMAVTDPKTWLLCGILTST